MHVLSRRSLAKSGHIRWADTFKFFFFFRKKESAEWTLIKLISFGKLTQFASLELEKERDFYFGKLRNVELMLQVQQDKNFEGSDLDAVVENIFKVLYATADEDVNLDEDGDVLPADEPADELNETAASAVSVPAQESEVF